MQAKSVDTDNLWEDIPAKRDLLPRLELLPRSCPQGGWQTPQCMVAMHYTALKEAL